LPACLICARRSPTDNIPTLVDSPREHAPDQLYDLTKERLIQDEVEGMDLVQTECLSQIYWPAELGENRQWAS